MVAVKSLLDYPIKHKRSSFKTGNPSILKKKTRSCPMRCQAERINACLLSCSRVLPLETRKISRAACSKEGTNAITRGTCPPPRIRELLQFRIEISRIHSAAQPHCDPPDRSLPSHPSVTGNERARVFKRRAGPWRRQQPAKTAASSCSSHAPAALYGFERGEG